MEQSVRERLEQLAEPAYREFSAGLLPGTGNILGVRLPRLRALAKELARGDWRAALEQEDVFFEETMLRGMVIGAARLPPEERLSLAAGFVPRIQNWSVCDSFCAGLKDAKKFPALYREFLAPYLSSQEEFPARFGAVMVLDYFLLPERLSWALPALLAVPAKGYYAQMGVAWALSLCLVKFPRETLPALESLPEGFVRSKAIQKALESRRTAPQLRETLRQLRGQP